MLSLHFYPLSQRQQEVWHHQAISWPNVGLLSVKPVGTHLNGLSIAIQKNCCLQNESHIVQAYMCRADSRLVPSQWETSLQSNAVSHWLVANLESALMCHKCFDSHTWCHCHQQTWYWPCNIGNVLSFLREIDSLPLDKNVQYWSHLSYFKLKLSPKLK